MIVHLQFTIYNPLRRSWRQAQGRRSPSAQRHGLQQRRKTWPS
ncbi:unnamed protein product [Penicillium nalgiovense]|nr:unnamed protein product [Penicillium nalgiovense]